MEGNAMAAMMNQGMHPGGMAHSGMIAGQPMNVSAESHAPNENLHQIQITEHAREQQKLYQRQMQFLLEGNPAAAAAFHGQANPTNINIQMNQMNGQSGQNAASITPSGKMVTSSAGDSETIELAQINFPALRLPTKGEPIDDDPLPDIGSDMAIDECRHPSQESESPPVNSDGLDDWILRNFKGEASPVSGKTASTGYSSAGCESPEASRATSSPELWSNTVTNCGRSTSHDSGNFSECAFNPAKVFPFKTDVKNQQAI